jgi:hypothetical protein
MPRFRETIPVDDYVIDVLMRDLVGHDRQPAAYLVYLHLYGQATRDKWKTVPASLRMLAEATGFSKSAVQSALENLRRRQLILTTMEHATALPRHRVLRHWRTGLPRRAS